MPNYEMKFGVSEAARSLEVNRDLIKKWAYLFRNYLEPPANGTGSVEWMKNTRICRLYLCKQLVIAVMLVCHKALQPIDIIESPIQLNQCRNPSNQVTNRAMRGVNGPTALK